MEKYILDTYKWVNNWVVGLNLCPFAHQVVRNETLRLSCSEAKTEEKLMLDFLKEIDHLLEKDAAAVETSILVHPFVLHDFEAYLDFVDIAQSALVKLGHEGVLQLASFHPDYQFAGTLPDDQSNYTNRSPYPMLHLLREDSVEQAIENYPDIESVPQRNISLLEDMSTTEFEKKWKKVLE